MVQRFQRRLLIYSPLCIVFGGGNAFSGEFERKKKERPRFHCLPCTN